MTGLVAKVIAALIAVESGGDWRAVGDGGKAVGGLQMWPVAVQEANRIEAIYARREGRTPRKWTLADRRNPTQGKEMAFVTLRWHYERGTRDPVKLGGKWRNPYGQAAPKWYLRRVRDALQPAGR